MPLEKRHQDLFFHEKLSIEITTTTHHSHHPTPTVWTTVCSPFMELIKGFANEGLSWL